jgi:hypothetical protein
MQRYPIPPHDRATYLRHITCQWRDDETEARRFRHTSRQQAAIPGDLCGYVRRAT